MFEAVLCIEALFVSVIESTVDVDDTWDSVGTWASVERPNET